MLEAGEGALLNLSDLRLLNFPVDAETATHIRFQHFTLITRLAGALCAHWPLKKVSYSVTMRFFFSFHAWNKIYVKKVYTSSQALCMWSCILAAYLLHTCKYPHCSRALTFEQNIEQKRTHAWPPGRSQRISRDVCFFCHKCVLVLSVCQLYLLIGYVFLFCFFGKIDCVRRNCSCVRFDRSLNKCLGWF